MGWTCRVIVGAKERFWKGLAHMGFRRPAESVQGCFRRVRSGIHGLAGQPPILEASLDISADELSSCVMPKLELSSEGERRAIQPSGCRKSNKTERNLSRSLQRFCRCADWASNQLSRLNLAGNVPCEQVTLGDVITVRLVSAQLGSVLIGTCPTFALLMTANPSDELRTA